MDLNYQEIADRAAAHALKSGIILDYSEKSIGEVGRRKQCRDWKNA